METKFENNLEIARQVVSYIRKCEEDVRAIEERICWLNNGLGHGNPGLLYVIAIHPTRQFSGEKYIHHSKLINFIDKEKNIKFHKFLPNFKNVSNHINSIRNRTLESKILLALCKDLNSTTRDKWPELILKANKDIEQFQAEKLMLHEKLNKAKDELYAAQLVATRRREDDHTQ